MIAIIIKYDLIYDDDDNNIDNEMMMRCDVVVVSWLKFSSSSSQWHARYYPLRRLPALPPRIHALHQYIAASRRLALQEHGKYDVARLQR